MYSSLLSTKSGTVKSRQTSNIPTHGFLSKCKNNLILPTDQSKSPEKTVKALSWNHLELSNSYTMVYPPIRRDNPRASASV